MEAEAGCNLGDDLTGMVLMFMSVSAVELLRVDHDELERVNLLRKLILQKLHKENKNLWKYVSKNTS